VLVALAQAGAESSDRDAFFKATLPLLRGATGADAVRVDLERAGNVTLLAEDGEEGAGEAIEHRLPGLDHITVTLRGSSITEQDLGGVWSMIDLSWSRLGAMSDLSDLQQRVNGAQHLANMGDYDWHISSDTNTWSDQLFRIYGYEPQEFNASYEKFLSMIHPDDREMIQGVHQQAYATGEPYQMIERIVRPTGELRYLASNGEVVMDENRNPVRMRGTCVDITERVRAEQVQARRKQALEINDNVVQGLTAAVMASEAGDPRAVGQLVERTLTSAKALVNEWLDPDSDGGIDAGDLVRSAHATLVSGA
jgi:PAS domain S-box-containing protein